MKVIRINWRLIKLLFLAISILCIFKTLIYYIFYDDYASLDFDIETKQFQIRFKDLTNQQQISNNHINDRVPFQLKSTSITYSKIPVQLWLNTIEKAITVGFNTIEIEIPWCLHQPFPGQFEFDKQSLDLETFIKLVHHYNLYLIIRLDPFIEDSLYDLGGLPAWLLGDLDLEKRENSNSKNGLLDFNDERFKSTFTLYLNELLPIIKRNQKWQQQGPIIGIAIQAYSKKLPFYDYYYIDFIEKQLYRHDIVEMLITSRSTCETKAVFCDPNIKVYFPARIDEIYLQNSISLNISKPILFSKDPLNKYKTILTSLLNTKKSFNIMNLYAGINLNSELGHLINENGDLTVKYLATKQLLLSDHNIANSINISGSTDRDNEIELKMNQFLYYEQILDAITPALQIKNNKKDLFIEFLSLDQNLDLTNAFYLIYSLKIVLLKDSLVYIKSSEITGYSIMICDKKKQIFTMDPKINSDEMIIIKLEEACTQIDLIVENSGRSSRLNDFKFYKQRKGVLKTDTIMFKQPNENFEISSVDWKIYYLDFKSKNFNKLYPNSQWLNLNESQLNMPFMGYVNFNVNKTLNSNKGVYLSMKQRSRGVCILNGLLLGQFSNKANQTLYIPNFLLTSGQNDLIVFEMVKLHETSVYFSNKNYR